MRIIPIILFAVFLLAVFQLPADAATTTLGERAPTASHEGDVA